MKRTELSGVLAGLTAIVGIPSSTAGHKSGQVSLTLVSDSYNSALHINTPEVEMILRNLVVERFFHEDQKGPESSSEIDKML